MTKKITHRESRRQRVDNINKIMKRLEASFTVVDELPDLIPEGIILHFNKTLWRGLLEGESSLPAGTPWPVKGYKELILKVIYNASIPETQIIEKINTNGAFTFTTEENGSITLTTAGLFPLNDIHISPAYAEEWDDFYSYKLYCSWQSVNEIVLAAMLGLNGQLSAYNAFGNISIRIFPPLP